MRVIVANLIRNFSRLEGGHAQQFFGFFDPGLRQVIFESLAGFMTEDHTEMAGAKFTQEATSLRDKSASVKCWSIKSLAWRMTPEYCRLA